jgi:1-acyl-sn-glycerol-3-phosphate acyltransferase
VTAKRSTKKTSPRTNTRQTRTVRRKTAETPTRTRTPAEQSEEAPPSSEASCANGLARANQAEQSEEAPPSSEASCANGLAWANQAEQTEEAPPSSEEPELGIGSRVLPPDMDYKMEYDSGPAHGADDRDADVEAQIRALEARLDGLIRGGAAELQRPTLREQIGHAAQKMVQSLNVPVERPGGDGGPADAWRELMSSDYYVRQWGRIGMRHRSEEVDDFGLDPTYEARLRPLLDFLYRRWFRVDADGIEHVPSEGRCIVVANHSGTLPLDGLMLRAAFRLDHPAHRELRWLAEDFIYYLPFVGASMNRIGAVRACQENAERLLRKGLLIAVFPEGVKGIGKLFRERYKLQRFGRGGFIRLALRTQTPVVPCAILGAEEANPMVYRIELPTKAFGLPYIPVTPTFPALGPLGLVPAPTKWRLELGEPLYFEGHGPEAAEDHVLVGRLAEKVRATIQRMLDEGRRRRQSVWLG